MTTWKEYKTTITALPHEDMTIIDTLADLVSDRIRRGISQKDFAAKIAMKQPQLAKIERLDSISSLVTLNRYANGLGMKVQISLVTA